jgi:hypothetical protein
LIGESDYIKGGTKMSIIQNARRRFLDIMVENLKKGDGWYTEDDSDINDGTRDVVEAMHDHYGVCWLGRINLRGKLGLVMWEYEERVCNFGADFVLPKYDKILHDLILKRDETSYTNVADDGEMLDPILDRIIELNGYVLTWV